jgi:hypothetical protein
VTDFVVIVAVGALAVLVVTELVAAALPVIVVIGMVRRRSARDSPASSPPAAVPGSWHLRSALRPAVRARQRGVRRTHGGDQHSSHDGQQTSDGSGLTSISILYKSMMAGERY